MQFTLRWNMWKQKKITIFLIYLQSEVMFGNNQHKIRCFTDRNSTKYYNKEINNRQIWNQNVASTQSNQLNNREKRVSMFTFTCKFCNKKSINTVIDVPSTKYQPITQGLWQPSQPSTIQNLKRRRSNWFRFLFLIGKNMTKIEWLMCPWCTFR